MPYLIPCIPNTVKNYHNEEENTIIGMFLPSPISEPPGIKLVPDIVVLTEVNFKSKVNTKPHVSSKMAIEEDTI